MVSEMTLTLVIIGCVSLLLVTLSVGAFGYRAALKHVERMAAIDPPERCELFKREPTADSIGALTPDDIDNIDDWDEE